MIKAINRSIAARHEEDEKGFTLIELLVVILIIGVLAAIAIPAFLNQREGAWASQVESDIKNATIAAESYAVANNGSYDGTPALEAIVEANGVVAPGGQWDENGFNGTEGVTINFALVAGSAGNDYTLTGSHASRGADTWVYTGSTGVIVFTDN